MSKYLLLIIFILISFSKSKLTLYSSIITSESTSTSNSSNTSLHFGKLLEDFFYGIANNDSSLCVATIKQNENYFHEIITGLLNTNDTFEEKLKNYGFKMVKIRGFIKNCQLSFLFKLYFDMTNGPRIANIGRILVNNSTYISSALDGILDKKSGNTFFKALGNVTKFIFNITVR